MTNPVKPNPAIPASPQEATQNGIDMLLAAARASAVSNAARASAVSGATSGRFKELSSAAQASRAMVGDRLVSPSTRPVGKSTVLWVLPPTAGPLPFLPLPPAVAPFSLCGAPSQTTAPSSSPVKPAPSSESPSAIAASPLPLEPALSSAACRGPIQSDQNSTEELINYIHKMVLEGFKKRMIAIQKEDNNPVTNESLDQFVDGCSKIVMNPITTPPNSFYQFCRLYSTHFNQNMDSARAYTLAVLLYIYLRLYPKAIHNISVEGYDAFWSNFSRLIAFFWTSQEQITPTNVEAWNTHNSKLNDRSLLSAIQDGSHLNIDQKRTAWALIGIKFDNLSLFVPLTVFPENLRSLVPLARNKTTQCFERQSMIKLIAAHRAEMCAQAAPEMSSSAQSSLSRVRPAPSDSDEDSSPKKKMRPAEPALSSAACRGPMQIHSESALSSGAPSVLAASLLPSSAPALSSAGCLGPMQKDETEELKVVQYVHEKVVGRFKARMIAILEEENNPVTNESLDQFVNECTRIAKFNYNIDNLFDQFNPIYFQFFRNQNEKETTAYTLAVLQFIYLRLYNRAIDRAKLSPTCWGNFSRLIAFFWTSQQQINPTNSETWRTRTPLLNNAALFRIILDGSCSNEDTKKIAWDSIGIKRDSVVLNVPLTMFPDSFKDLLTPLMSNKTERFAQASIMKLITAYFSKRKAPAAPLMGGSALSSLAHERPVAVDPDSPHKKMRPAEADGDRVESPTSSKTE